MESFFINIGQGPTRGPLTYWVVPSSSIPNNSRDLDPFCRGHVLDSLSRSGSPAATDAIGIRDSSGCHVVVRAGTLRASVTSSNECEQGTDQSHQAFLNTQFDIKPAMAYRRRRSDGVRLSIAMAAHNEQNTIEAAISHVLAVNVPCEIELIVVDDGSTDGTLKIIQSFNDPRLNVLIHESCQGKGASILDAAAVATGTHMLVFDADLEYSADDIPALIEPVLKDATSVVYGTRINGSRGLLNSLVYGLGSKLTTAITNIVYGSRLRDMHTCLKLIPLALFRQLTLSNSGFGLDTEISCELLRRKIRFHQVSCSYRARSVAEGKQISLQDGLECLRIILQVRLRRRAILRRDITEEPITIQLSPTIAD